MTIIKPKNPDSFNWNRKEFTVSVWIYQVTQYLTLFQFLNTQKIDDTTKLEFSDTFMNISAATSWYTIVASKSTPTT